jgi:hypothetical protein
VSPRWAVGLFLAGLLMAVTAASLQTAPGYMDADYYYAGALRLVRGQGASEPYLWNYLNDPPGLPAPSFAYWMPLVSYVSAAGLWLFPRLGFWGARLGAILLAALVPPLAAALAGRLDPNPRSARLAGLLALFPGFYLAYQATTDAFPIYMVLGSLFFLAAVPGGLARAPVGLRALPLGLLAGLFHLTRADGLLWLAGALLAVWLWPRAGQGGGIPRLLTGWLAVLAGYSLVMAPWFARNLAEWGRLLPPGGGRALWITEYEQTMLFPASQLSPDHWLAAGWGAHLRARLSALGLNLQTAVAVQGGIVLFLFVLAGMWKLRCLPMVRLGGWMWLLTAGVMTVVFPFAGGNGGFFHSGAAVQPLFWAVVPTGLESLGLAYARWRGLRRPWVMVRFLSGLVVAAGIMLTIFLYANRVVGSRPGGLAWNASQAHYREVEQALLQSGAQPGDPVLVNNPPGFWSATGRSAVVIPYGDESMLLAAARRYGVRFLVLEITNPPQLSALYHGRVDPPELEYLASVGLTRLYRIHSPERR